MKDLHEIISFLKKKKWVDLSHNINKDIPYFTSFKPIEETTLFTVEDDGFFAKEYMITGQYGTHIDAPIHFNSSSTKDVSNIELKELVAPLYVLHLEDKVELDNDYCLTIQDILDFESKHGLIPEDSFVAFSSNWSKRWHNSDEFYNYDENGDAHTPGWSIEAVEFLIKQRNIIAIGHETLDTDPAKQAKINGFLYAEKTILDAEKYQIEVMTNLDLVPSTGAVIISLVPKIDKASGFPIRSIAIIPD